MNKIREIYLIRTRFAKEAQGILELSLWYWNCTDHYYVAEIKGKSITDHQ